MQQKQRGRITQPHKLYQRNARVNVQRKCKKDDARKERKGDAKGKEMGSRVKYWLLVGWLGGNN